MFVFRLTFIVLINIGIVCFSFVEFFNSNKSYGTFARRYRVNSAVIIA